MPEVRLIDANAFHAKIMKDNDNDLSRKENIAQFLLRIETEPTIEAEPIRHGRWKIHILKIGGGDKIRSYLCSECDRYVNMRSDFCPNCGCKMQDGGAENG